MHWRDGQRRMVHWVYWGVYSWGVVYWVYWMYWVYWVNWANCVYWVHWGMMYCGVVHLVVRGGCGAGDSVGGGPGVQGSCQGGGAEWRKRLQVWLHGGWSEGF